MQSQRFLILNIDDNKDGTYRLTIMHNNGIDRYDLPFNKADLEAKLAFVNLTLTKIIHRKEDGQPSEYVRGLKVSDKICISDMRRIYKLNLTNFLFRGEGGNYTPQGEERVKFIKEYSRNNAPLNIQVISSPEFRFPWTLLYDGEDFTDEQKVDESTLIQHFWGFKHIIEQPIPPNDSSNYSIKLSKSSFNFFLKEDLVQNNARIQELVDDFYKSNLGPIEEQRKFFFQECKFDKIEHCEKAKLLKALREKRSAAILYFYCHANYEPFYSIIRDESYIQLMEPKSNLDSPLADDEDPDKIRLSDLKINFDPPNRSHFMNKPLIFINACQSAAISPSSYDSFVSFFLERGAGGVMGTLAEIPLIFASKFALSFFRSLFKGNRVDEAILESRNEFIGQYHNILGLYYTSSCHPGLKVELI